MESRGVKRSRDDYAPEYVADVIAKYYRIQRPTLPQIESGGRSEVVINIGDVDEDEEKIEL